MQLQNDPAGHGSAAGFLWLPAGIRPQKVRVETGRAVAKGGAVSLQDLLAMFSGRIIGTYTPEQYANCVREARANRMRWGMGQW